MVNGRRAVNNPLALAVLAYLMERPMHPYELGKLLKQRQLHKSVNYKHSSLYAVVEQLNRVGYIEPQQTLRDTRRPERTLYTLTPAGQEELRAWMRDLIAAPVKEFRGFEAALALVVVLPPAEVAELLQQREQALEAEAERLDAKIQAPLAPDMDRVFRIEDEYQLALVEAELVFIRRFRERIIVAGDPEFGRFWRTFHST
ncbi:PadR family transcriptional regulator [Streptosporangium carneum]|uniref:PadR family transcriptional regulator n=1 Tax=Streptosporangium carneum TaxID=47481 RepID=A0A9W6MF59_9ACTN|nr:PadR family transcriptional regulator [Streptosporangium carneum]GLK11832.1 PadR family transcriptional regulator [Streptosporangium carneum]